MVAIAVMVVVVAIADVVGDGVAVVVAIPPQRPRRWPSDEQEGARHARAQGLSDHRERASCRGAWGRSRRASKRRSRGVNEARAHAASLACVRLCVSVCGLRRAMGVSERGSMARVCLDGRTRCVGQSRTEGSGSYSDVDRAGAGE